MKIQKYNTIQDIPVQMKNACVAGKWNQWRRVFIAKADAQFQVFSLNLLQRFAAAFLSIFQFNYFQMILGKKEFKILGPKDLNPTAKKVAAQAPQPPAISIPEPPAVPQGTQPDNIRVIPAPVPRTINDISPERKREFEQHYQLVGADHLRDEIRAHMRGLYRANPAALQELEIYLNWKLPAGPQPALPIIPGLTPEEVRRFESRCEYNRINAPNRNIVQDLRDDFSYWGPDMRNKLEIYLNHCFPHHLPQQANPVGTPQQQPPQNPVIATPHLDALPVSVRPLRFIHAPNGLSQYNRDGDRFKSSCALMSAAYLTANKQATPQLIEEAIRSPVNPADEHLGLGDDQVAKYRHGGNRLAPIPAQNVGGMEIYDHTVLEADWPHFLQGQFDVLFRPTLGCLILSNSKTYCVRRMTTSNRIELFDSHGYSQLTGANGGFVAEFRDLKHLKDFFAHFQPFQPIPGGQPGFSLLFAKSVKA